MTSRTARSTERTETKRLEGIFGPYAGQVIDVSDADAKVAIAEKWARDHFAERDADEVAIVTPDDITKVTDAANAAALKLQAGETLVTEPPDPENILDNTLPEPEADDDDNGGSTRRKSVSAEDGGSYKTRSSRKG